MYGIAQFLFGSLGPVIAWPLLMSSTVSCRNELHFNFRYLNIRIGADVDVSNGRRLILRRVPQKKIAAIV